MSDEIPQFIGEYEDVPVDPKGRLIFPAPFRRALPMGINSVVIAQWFDGCLSAFDPKGWNGFMQQLRGLDGTQRQTRQLVRSLAGRAAEVKLDAQGRALIPRKLLDLAGITEQATLVGVIDRVEIWSPERYKSSLEGVNLEEIAEELEWF